MTIRNTTVKVTEISGFQELPFYRERQTTNK